MSSRTKILLGGGTVALVLAFLAGVLVSDRLDGEAPVPEVGQGPSTDGMETESSMEGMAQESSMAGMDMAGSIHLSEGEVATFGITFDTVAVRSLSRAIRAVGRVEFDERRMTWVSPKFGGWAERLHVDFTGQRVTRGEPLLDVYSPELVTAQEELVLAAGMVDTVSETRLSDVAAGARDLLASARRRLDYWDISQGQIDRLLETGEVRRVLTLHAPVSGVVMEKDIVAGQAFQAGKDLYMIADLSEVWVNADVFESDVAMVRQGMRARVTVDAVPGRTFEGRIEYVYPTLEEETRSIRARVVLPNPEGTLKPGMYATVQMTAELGEALTVPSSAVLYTGERAVAFVDRGGGELVPHELELGVRGGDRVQVLSGLEAGQRVVTSAQFLLDSESNLAEVMRGMMAQMNMSDMEGMDMEGMDMGEEGGMDGMDMDVRPDSTGGR